jgi:hypothetical protein
MKLEDWDEEKLEDVREEVEDGEKIVDWGRRRWELNHNRMVREYGEKISSFFFFVFLQMVNLF